MQIGAQPGPTQAVGTDASPQVPAETPALERGIPLRNVPLFAGLDDASIEKLCHFLQIEQFNAPRQLFRTGDPGEAMYVIVSGRVRITVTDADGREVILAALGPGDFFGEMAMLDGHGRSADASVVESGQAGGVNAGEFFRVYPQRYRYGSAHAQHGNASVTPHG